MSTAPSLAAAAKLQPTEPGAPRRARSSRRRRIAAGGVALGALMIAGALVAIIVGGGSGKSPVTVISQNPEPALILPSVHGLTAVDARETQAPGGYRYGLVLSKVNPPRGASVDTPVTYYFTLSVRRGNQPFVLVHRLKLPYPFTAGSNIADFSADSNPDGTANASLSWYVKQSDQSDHTQYFTLTPSHISLG